MILLLTLHLTLCAYVAAAVAYRLARNMADEWRRKPGRGFPVIPSRSAHSPRAEPRM